MVWTGLRLVIGSWNTIAIRLPRTWRIRRSDTRSRSVPSKAHRPPTTRPARRGSRRMMESAVTLLPQPDSPTMPSVSPAAIVKLTPSTARVDPVLGEEIRAQIVDFEQGRIGHV